MNINYTEVITFTKHTSLSAWFDAHYRDRLGMCATSVGFNQLRNKYAQPRDVQLILLVRYEPAKHPICKIKCPISPLPIRGEFEVVSVGEMVDFLNREGWKVKQKMPVSLLK